MLAWYLKHHFSLFFIDSLCASSCGVLHNNFEDLGYAGPILYKIYFHSFKSLRHTFHFLLVQAIFHLSANKSTHLFTFIPLMGIYILSRSCLKQKWSILQNIEIMFYIVGIVLRLPISLLNLSLDINNTIAIKKLLVF